MPMLNRCRTFFAVTLLALLWSVGASAAPTASGQATRANQPQTLDRIVAVVNDGVITQNQLNSRVRSASMQLQRQKVQLPPGDILRQQVLEQMITERTQVQVAQEAGIRVEDTELEQALNRIAANQKMSTQQMRQMVEKDG
ncbi:SurA N-terminal domain-containing protein, partial [Yokenella regensburgei]|uniref:SurA N-terminal domain-containing protein n=1 Tax=Yokenella regensburgei TaxID=158877 RepID=UPI0035AF3E87